MRASLLTKTRFEAFSDGVMAIIATIMVLGIPPPDASNWDEMVELIRSVLIYFVSFFLVGFYWRQHYRMCARLKTISRKVIWRNMLFLFALSLLPVFTGWMIRFYDQAVPAIGYLLMFLLVNASSRLLFYAVVDESVAQVLRQIRPASVGRTAAVTLAVIGLIALSAVMPRLACILLIAFPVAMSLFSLLFEREPGERARPVRQERTTEG